MIRENNLKLADEVKKSQPGKSVGETGGGMVAFTVATAVVAEVENDRRTKNVQPQVHWDFYHAKQEQYFIRRKGEDDVQYRKRKEDGKPVNYVRFVVNLDTRFLYGRPKKIGRLFGDNEKTESRMREINKLIKIDNLQMEAKRKASLFGEQGFRLIPVDKRTKSQIDLTTTVDDNIYPHPIPLDPRESFFMLNSYGKIIAVVLKWKFRDFVNEGNSVQVVELVTDDSRWVWHDDSLQEVSDNKFMLFEEFVLQVNNHERIDDVQDILKLQTALNECISDNSYFFAKHGRPQLVSSVDLSNVINKGDQVWQINMEDDENVKVLEKLGFLVWDGKMEASKEHLLTLKAELLTIASTAAIASGDLQGIGNLRSGAALLTAFAPSIQKAQESQVIWSSNEENLAQAIVAFDSRLHSQDNESRFPEFDFSIKFPNDSGVPGEEILTAEVRQININSHLQTMEELILQDHPGFSKENVQKYRSQLILDSTELGDALRIFQQKEDPNASGNGNSSGSKKSAEQK